MSGAVGGEERKRGRLAAKGAGSSTFVPQSHFPFLSCPVPGRLISEDHLIRAPLQAAFWFGLANGSEK